MDLRRNANIRCEGCLLGDVQKKVGWNRNRVTCVCAVKRKKNTWRGICQELDWERRKILERFDAGCLVRVIFLFFFFFFKDSLELENKSREAFIRNGTIREQRESSIFKMDTWKWMRNDRLIGRFKTKESAEEMKIQSRAFFKMIFF